MAIRNIAANGLNDEVDFRGFRKWQNGLFTHNTMFYIGCLCWFNLVLYAAAHCCSNYCILHILDSYFSFFLAQPILKSEFKDIWESFPLEIFCLKRAKSKKNWSKIGEMKSVLQQETPRQIEDLHL